MATVFGSPVGTLGRGFYERIGVSFELPALYLRLSAVENLRLFAGLYDRPTRDPLAVLAEVDLGEEADRRVEHFSKDEDAAEPCPRPADGVALLRPPCRFVSPPLPTTSNAPSASSQQRQPEATGQRLACRHRAVRPMSHAAVHNQTRAQVSKSCTTGYTRAFTSRVAGIRSAGKDTQDQWITACTVEFPPGLPFSRIIPRAPRRPPSRSCRRSHRPRRVSGRAAGRSRVCRPAAWRGR